MKLVKKFAVVFMAAALAVGGSVVPQNPVVKTEIVEAKKAIKLSEESLTMKIDDVAKLKVKGTKKKVKWSSSDENVAVVSKKGKVLAVGAGLATITAKVGKKSLTCEVTVEGSEGPVDPIAGGWEIPETPEVDEEIAAYVAAATASEVGIAYYPVAVLATQVVEGMNYKLLCTATPVTEDPVSNYVVATMYVGLDGTAAFDDVVIDTQRTVGTGEADGGWGPAMDCPVVSAEDTALFVEAMKGWTGSALSPIAHLETQVVAGTNELFVCTVASLGDENAAPQFCFVVINNPATGEPSVTDMDEIKTDGGEDPIPSVEEWVDYEEIVTTILTGESEAAFAEATKELEGTTFEPAALLAVQDTVDGTNYAFLARVTTVVEEPKTVWAVVTVDVDKEGKAGMVDCEPIFDENDAAKITEEPYPEGLDTWGVYDPEVAPDNTLPADIIDYFGVANEEYTGVGFMPVALLQTKAGEDHVDYRILCVGMTATETPDVAYYLVTIHAPETGDAYVEDVEMLDILDYVTE